MDTNVQTYSCYGLQFRSEIPLPELLPVPFEEAEVWIRRGDAGLGSGIYAGKDSHVAITSDEAHLYWREVGAFRVRKGCEIIVETYPSVEEKLVRLPLLNVVMAALLYQRGIHVLHASAVAIDGGAVAFVGNKGWGKSTTAAALHARGHRVIADDVLPVFASPVGMEVAPGYAQLKLWPEAATAAFGDAPETLSTLYGNVTKRVRNVDRGFSTKTLPLTCVYVLGGGQEHGIEPITPQEALIEMVRHSYAINAIKDARLSASIFQACSSLVRQVPVRRLRRRADLAALDGIAEMIEADSNVHGVERVC